MIEIVFTEKRGLVYAGPLGFRFRSREDGSLTNEEAIVERHPEKDWEEFPLAAHGTNTGSE